MRHKKFPLRDGSDAGTISRVGTTVRKTSTTYSVRPDPKALVTRKVRGGLRHRSQLLSKKSDHRLTHKSRTRRVLRAAVTIGTATTIFCGTYPFTAQAAITSGPEVEALKR